MNLKKDLRFFLLNIINRKGDRIGGGNVMTFGTEEQLIKDAKGSSKYKHTADEASWDTASKWDDWSVVGIDKYFGTFDAAIQYIQTEENKKTLGNINKFSRFLKD